MPKEPPLERSAPKRSAWLTLALALALALSIALIAFERSEEPVALSLTPTELDGDDDDIGDHALELAQPEPFVPDLPAVPDLAARAEGEGAISPEAAPERDTLLDEMQLVRDARRAVEHDPRAALDLLDRHRERFPDGALAEEREAYAILAMLLLRAPASDVERRFSDLLARFPESQYATTIRDAIARREGGPREP